MAGYGEEYEVVISWALNGSVGFTRNQLGLRGHVAWLINDGEKNRFLAADVFRCAAI